MTAAQQLGQPTSVGMSSLNFLSHNGTQWVSDEPSKIKPSVPARFATTRNINT